MINKVELEEFSYHTPSGKIKKRWIVYVDSVIKCDTNNEQIATTYLKALSHSYEKREVKK